MDDKKQKKILFNKKQRDKYNNNIEYRNKKKEQARNYYENRKYNYKEGSVIAFSNETKKIYFE